MALSVATAFVIQHSDPQNSKGSGLAPSAQELIMNDQAMCLRHVTMEEDSQSGARSKSLTESNNHHCLLNWVTHRDGAVRAGGRKSIKIPTMERWSRCWDEDKVALLIAPGNRESQLARLGMIPMDEDADSDEGDGGAGDRTKGNMEDDFEGGQHGY